MAREKAGEWVRRWNRDISKEPVSPGVYRLKTGGYLVRVRVVVNRGARKVREDMMRSLPEATLAEARRTRDELALGLEAEKRIEKTRFSDFAISLLERKAAAGELSGRNSRRVWAQILEHHLLPFFGDMSMSDITRIDVADFRQQVAVKVRKGEISPRTGNGWITNLKVIMRAATYELELPRNPCEGLKPIDTKAHPSYTEEQPNSLLPHELREFLAKCREVAPQWYAMILLGFFTGLRPSSLRPLRRRGPQADVKWAEGRVLIRRSHTFGDEVQERTKTGLVQALALPVEVMEALRAHDRWINTREGFTTAGKAVPWSQAMAESDLLFPAFDGGFRSTIALNCVFRRICSDLGWTKKVTPRAMRRTFVDLARLAGISDVVARSVTGHKTVSIHHHYQTVPADEMRQALEKISSRIA